MARILIAEDERDIRDLIQFTLMFAGHEVTAAANGEEALRLAPGMNPDLILMDVRMPKMTGLEACREMRKVDSLKETPVIFLTARGQDEDRQTGIEVGATDYLLKPFAPEELTQRIGDILKARGIG